MILFDPYVPETWVVDGLTIDVPQPTKRRRSEKLKKGWRALSSAVIVSVGMALVTFSFTPGVTGLGGAATMGASSANVVPSGPEIPAGYLPKLVTLLRNSPVLPEEDFTHDPVPLA